MNDDVNGNRKLLRKEVSNTKGGKVKSCSRIKEANGRSVEVCRRRELKINAGKSKVMVLNGEEKLKCEVHVDWIRLEHVSKFKY